MNILFDRETLHVVGRNRPALPFEVEIRDVTERYLQVGKTIEEGFEVPMSSEDGTQLYALKTPVYEMEPTIQRFISIEPSEEPVLITRHVQVPLMRNGEQLVYYPTYLEVEQIETGVDEDGNPVFSIIEHERVSEVGVPLFTTEIEEHHGEDSEGNPQYWHEDIEDVPVQVGETVEYVTEDDERWTPELPKAMQTEIRSRYITLQDEPQRFTYADVVELVKKPSVRELALLPLLYYSEIEDSEFSTELATHDAHMGAGFVSIPAGGQIRTKKLPLGIATSALELYIEASGDLEVHAGATAADLIEASHKRVTLPSTASEVYVLFKNTGTKAVDLYAFGIFG